MPDRQYRVLLVEDDEASLNMIRTLLAQCGLRGKLIHAASYFDAVEEMSKAEYDICLLSADLEGGMGLELIREAAELGFPGPFVLLVGDEEIHLEDQEVALSVADFLPRQHLSAPLLAWVIRYTVERAGMVEALRELAIRDELTGLYNRRELRRILTQEVSRSLRYRNPLSLVIIEVDSLREIIDRYGQSVGDAVLQWVAQLLRDGVRTTDHPARYGDDSLAVVLPETRKAAAYIVTERLSKAVSSQKVTVANPDRRPLELSVSISSGIGGLPGDANSEDGLVDAAIQDLYEARQRALVR
jgi:diguanylate cyclase (GGDEF)-like protein